MIKTQAKTLTFAEFYEKFKQISYRLFVHEVDYTIRVKGKSVVFVSVYHCDSAKIAVPEFQIKHDERQKRFAELTISYE